MKILWDFGESVVWKQEENIFEGVNEQRTLSDVRGINHKNQTELMFNGISKAAIYQRRAFQFFDGSSNQEQTGV